jgi:hypothetical protein
MKTFNNRAIGVRRCLPVPVRVALDDSVRGGVFSGTETTFQILHASEMRSSRRRNIHSTVIM